MVHQRVLSLFDRRLRSDFRTPLRIGKACRKGFQGRSRQSLLMLLCGLTRTAKVKAGLRTWHFQIFLLGERNYAGKRDSSYKSESRECLKEVSLHYRLKNGCSHHRLSSRPYIVLKFLSWCHCLRFEALKVMWECVTHNVDRDSFVHFLLVLPSSLP